MIHLATRRISNIDNIDVEIGQITFIVPNVVKAELNELKKNLSKKQDVEETLNYIKNFQTLQINGTFADKEIVDYISKNNVFVATMDKELKQQIKSKGRSIISFSNNRIVLES